MKCLLCNLQCETSNELKDKITISTFIKLIQTVISLKKLFNESKNKIVCQTCFRCDKFLTTKSHKNVQNFLKHYVDYVDGKTKSFEDKPIEIKEIGNLKSYEISYNKHGHIYDFSNADELVDEFLRMLQLDLSLMVVC